MWPTITNPVVEISMHGIVTAGGSQTKNSASVFHFRSSAPTTTINKPAIEAAFSGQIAAPILALLNNRYTQTFNTVRLLNNPLDPLYQAAETGVGAITGDSMPMANQSFVLARTAVRGKSFKGAKKLFPLSESDTTHGTDDILNAAALARYATLATAWLAGFTDGVGIIWLPVIVSKKKSQLLAGAPISIVGADIIQILTNKRIGRNKKHEVSSVY
jgi:hypothetical protein